MSEVPAARPTMTTDEINGRIAEIEAQREGALTRCARIAGEKALLVRTLEDARAEIERLSALLAEKGAGAGSAGGSADTAH